jgi:hypothetical protein
LQQQNFAERNLILQQLECGSHREFHSYSYCMLQDEEPGVIVTAGLLLLLLQGSFYCSTVTKVPLFLQQLERMPAAAAAAAAAWGTKSQEL